MLGRGGTRWCMFKAAVSDDIAPDSALAGRPLVRARR